MRRGVRGDGRLIVPLMSCLCVAFAIATPVSSDPTGPDSADLRPVFDRWELAPRAQGSRNTCSAFTITGAIEYALAEKRRQGTRLSVEFLNWVSNRAIGEQADGGFFSDLWKGLESYGICDEDDMSYVAEFDPGQQPSRAACERRSESAAPGGGRWAAEK